jgi:fused signal recognition particle receptor
MPTPEELKAAQEAEAAAQAAAAAAQAEEEEPEKPVPADDPKILRAELKKVRDEAAAARVKLRELAEKERKAAEEKALTEGKFREVAEQREKRAKELEAELEQSRAKLTAFEQREAEETARRAAQVDAEFAQLPESYRARVPAEADLRTKEVYLAAYREAKGLAPKPPTIPTAAPRPAAPGDLKAPYTPEQLRVFNQIAGNPRAPQAKRDEALAALAKDREFRRARAG